MQSPHRSVLALLFTLTACGSDGAPTSADAAGGATASSTTSASTGGSGGAGPIAPSGHILVPADRLDALAAKVASNAPEWARLKTNVDAHMSGLDAFETGPENIALVYLLTKDARYADAAYAWAKHLMDTEDVRFDSYLRIGDLLRQVALVLNWCGDALDDAKGAELAAYLDRWVHELWFDNQGNGWGLEDPGNNYHLAFLEASAYAGYALAGVGHDRGQTYVDLVIDRVERAGGVRDYIEHEGKGGDWHEGANYGERSKQRLYSALSAVASMGGPNYFAESAFFAESIYYALYQLQPDDESLYPGGDLARDPRMRATGFDRDYIQVATYFVQDQDARALGQWYLNEIVPEYTQKSLPLPALLHKDVLFGTDVEPQSRDALPLGYRAIGTQWVNARSGWDAHATSVSISGTPNIHQSHAHFDVGSFTIYKEDWLAVDAASFGVQGGQWDSGAHNMVHVEGHERRGGDVPGLTRYLEEPALTYVSVDASNLYRYKDAEHNRTMLDEYTRELVYLRPNTVITYDRVAPKPEGESYDLRFHFPKEPEQDGDRFTAAYHGGGVSFLSVVGGAISVLPDTDLVEGPSNAWRVEIAPTSKVSRFLSVVQVATGAPPKITATHVTSAGQVEGVVVGSDAVIFSKNDKGAPAALPFSYGVPSSVVTHTLVNVGGSVDVTLTPNGGAVEVTVSAGSRWPSKEGVVRVTP